MTTGHYAEGMRRMQAVRDGAAPGTLARAHALNGLTAISMTHGDWKGGAAAAEEALALHKSLGHRWGIANSIFLLGHVAAEARDYPLARDRFVESLAVFRELEDSHYTILVTRNLAWMEYELGNPAASEALHEEMVRVARDADNPRMEGGSLGALAEIAIQDGRMELGLRRLRESTRITVANGERIETTINLRRYARAMVESGDAATGVRFIGAADAANERMGAAGRVAYTRDLDPGTLEIARRSLTSEQVETLRSEGRSMSLDDAVALLLGD